MLAPSEQVKTAPTQKPLQSDLDNIKHAVFQGELGLSEKGVPIGAALVRNDVSYVLSVASSSSRVNWWTFRKL